MVERRKIHVVFTGGKHLWARFPSGLWRDTLLDRRHVPLVGSPVTTSESNPSQPNTAGFIGPTLH
ncbi:hypothetical protein V7x_52930 [Crateriforma conspicua]|uniref:Uncharacterized protein n=1 Tax=Crateriforma conspicua TaxID=2527996 RepID=A0A5C6FLS3_9PLAN|nr:hypothetical protein V7x_52930 [Crateriforma conspicua]